MATPEFQNIPGKCLTCPNVMDARSRLEILRSYIGLLGTQNGLPEPEDLSIRDAVNDAWRLCVLIGAAIGELTEGCPGALLQATDEANSGLFVADCQSPRGA